MKEMFEKIKHSFFSILMPGFFIVVMLLNVLVSSVGIDEVMKIPAHIVSQGIVVTTETGTETIEKEVTEKNRMLPVESLPNKNATKVTTVTREISEDFSKSIFDWGVAGIVFILFCLSYLVGSIIRAISVDVFDIYAHLPLFYRSYWNNITHKSRFPYPVMLFALQSQMSHKPKIKGILDEISKGVREKYESIFILQDTISQTKKELNRYKNDTSLAHKLKKEHIAGLKKIVATCKKDLKRKSEERKINMEKISVIKKEIARYKKDTSLVHKLKKKHIAGLKKIVSAYKKVREADRREGNSILHNRFNYCKMYLCHHSFSLFTFIREYEERVRLFTGMCWAGLIGGLANLVSLFFMGVPWFSGFWVITLILLCLSVLLFTIFLTRIRHTRSSEVKRVYLGYALVKAGEENTKNREK